MIDSSFADLTQLVNAIFQQKIDNIDNHHKNEVLLTLSDTQVNDSLKRFVTDNVGVMLNLSVELHSGWFRLFCTIDVSGIFADVFADFELVQIELNKQRQRLVFQQLTHTQIRTLQATSYPKKLAINSVITYFHKILNKDPLGMIFGRFDFAHNKDNIIYIDIGRWIGKNQKIMNILTKTQVNTATTDEKQLLLKMQLNYRNLLASNQPRKKDIITEADNPKLNQTNPINKDSKEQLQTTKGNKNSVKVSENTKKSA